MVFRSLSGMSKRVSQTLLKKLNQKRKGAQILKGKLCKLFQTMKGGHDDNTEQGLVGLPFSISTRRHLSNPNLSFPQSHCWEFGNLGNPTAVFLKLLQETSLSNGQQMRAATFLLGT